MAYGLKASSCHPLIDWLFTHISISLQRGQVNLSASAHAQHDSISICAMKGCVWLAGAKEFKHTIKTPLHIIFLSYIYNILPQYVFLEMQFINDINAGWQWVYDHNLWSIQYGLTF